MSGRCIPVISLVLLLCLIGAASAQAPDPDVGWWKFDEGFGDTVGDSSGNDYTGTIQSATWQDGGWNGLGWSLDFDGNDDRVELGAIDVEGAGITLTGWIQPDDFEIDDARIISKANEWGGNDHWWMMGQINQSFLRFRLKTTDGQATTTLIASTGELRTGEWQHAAATWDGQSMRLYLNAEEVASTPKGGDAVATDGNVKAAIGSQPEGAYNTDPLHANKFFDGRIDEVRIYSYALSQAELAELIKGVHPTAWDPDPADGAVGVAQPLMRWQPSETGFVHNVYLGTGPELGADDLVAQNVGQALYWHAAGFEPGVTYYWRVDDIEADGTIITGKVWSFTSATVVASQPQPADGAKWIDPGAVTLVWVPGQGALTHDVYFGTNADDVAAGTADTSKGNQLLPEFGVGSLAEDTTYYWRVDEVGAGDTIEAGAVWSFTTAGPGGGIKGEYFGSPDLIGEPVMVRIDPRVDFQWANAGPGDPLPAADYSVRWTGEVEAAFTETYTLQTRTANGVRLWFNGKLVVDKWFAQERGAPSYSVTVEMEAGRTYPIMMEYYFSTSSAVAELWWESAHTPRQIIPAGALSLPVRAFDPRPVDEAVDTPQTFELTWKAGESAAQHDVYFGADEEAVANATTASAGIYRGRQALDATSYNPGPLDWNTTYYWRVDEVNAADPAGSWKGNVWNFATADFIVIDDFESYNNAVGSRVFEVWIDGIGFTQPEPGNPGNGTGAAVGHDIWSPDSPHFEGTIMETEVIHGGDQSMPLYYNNAETPWYSKAERTWAAPQDWTVNGVDTLTLYVRGSTDNEPDTLYVQVTDSGGRSATVSRADAADTGSLQWIKWKIPLSQFADNGVVLTAITKIAIGAGNPDNPTPAGAGVLYFDDVRVTKP